MTLHEYKQVRQVTGYFRRWFNDEYFDLIVWYDDAHHATGFQLCYDIGRDEHAFTWREGKGFAHNRVDDGEGPTGGAMKGSPILVPDGIPPFAAVRARFEAASAQLEPVVRRLVLEKLKEYQEQPP